MHFVVGVLKVAKQGQLSHLLNSALWHMWSGSSGHGTSQTTVLQWIILCLLHSHSHSVLKPSIYNRDDGQHVQLTVELRIAFAHCSPSNIPWVPTRHRGERWTTSLCCQHYPVFVCTWQGELCNAVSLSLHSCVFIICVLTALADSRFWEAPAVGS